MNYHLDMMFSTYDQDNDGWDGWNSASTYRGGWWYGKGHVANLNGLYNNTGTARGVSWYLWMGHEYSLRFTEMKIRAANY